MASSRSLDQAHQNGVIAHFELRSQCSRALSQCKPLLKAVRYTVRSISFRVGSGYDWLARPKPGVTIYASFVVGKFKWM